METLTEKFTPVALDKYEFEKQHNNKKIEHFALSANQKFNPKNKIIDGFI